MPRALLMLLLAFWLSPAPVMAGQNPPAKAAPERRGPDVVVTAPAEGAKSAAQQTPPQNAERAVYMRQASADARLFSRCLKASDAQPLRALLDGPPNSGARADGLDRIVRKHLACYPGLSTVSEATIGFYGDCDPRGHKEISRDRTTYEVNVRTTVAVCQTFYTRGALVEQALRLYAPQLSFTTTELAAPAVMARYLARERRFDASRGQQERIYAQIAGCVVALHPADALALANSQPNGRKEARMRTALLDTAPACTGGAKHVVVDGPDFRVFVADAIYGWAVALRGMDSLIPAG